MSSNTPNAPAPAGFPSRANVLDGPPRPPIGSAPPPNPHPSAAADRNATSSASADGPPRHPVNGRFVSGS